MKKLNLNLYILPIMLILLSISCNKTSSEKQRPDFADTDTTVNLKNDFEAFANNEWRKKNPLPAEKSRFGSFDKLNDNVIKQIQSLFKDLTDKEYKKGTVERKISDFYKSGMDTETIEKEGLKPIKKYLDQIESISTIEDLKKLIIKWQPLYLNPFFSFGEEPDLKNSDMGIASLDQGGLGLSDRDYYLDKDDKTKNIQKKYRALISGIFQLSGTSKAESDKQSETIYNIEEKIAKFSMSRLDRRDPYNVYHMMTPSEIDKLTPGFNWSDFFRETGLKNPGKINVSTPDFFKNLDLLIESEPVDSWKSYLKYHLISDFTGQLPQSYIDLSFDFWGKTLSGALVNRPRWKRVQGLTNSILGEAVGQMYIKRYFPPEAKKQMETLVGNLLNSLGERIKKLTWMTDTTKQKALEKLKAITVKVGYPNKWKDYTNLSVSPDSYMENVINANKFYFQRELKKINKPVDKEEWYMTPQTVNAYYNPSANEIVFPAAILQPPFFYFNGDDAINYGAIGVVIGHEMTHGFDNEGRKFDKEGNLNEWWTEEDAKKFEDKTEILVKQFNQFTVQDTIKANGKLCLGENIADLGGLNISFDAMEKAINGDKNKIEGWTPEQRFFLSYAHVWAQNIREEEKLRLTKVDVHSLGKYRVIGPLRNLKSFYDAFNIKEGDEMYLPKEQRAIIW